MDRSVNLHRVFQGASGMAIDSAGNIIQANIRGNFISRVSPSGTVTTIASQGFAAPVGVAVNSAGQIFVANCGNNTISRINNGVGVTFSSGPLFQCPNGLASDADDNLYTVNFNNGSVIKIDPQGNASIFANSGGGNGHIVYGNDRLYFTSHGQRQVFELSLDGELKVLAGSGAQGHLDGEALSATFTALNGIGLSPDGSTLYVNETVAVGPPALVNLNPNTLRAIDLDVDEPTFNINPGLMGSWYDPNQDGQGMVLDFALGDDRFDAVMFWFTYNDQPADAATEILGFGSTQSRWFIGVGPVEGGSVTMPIIRSSGGVFYDPATVDSAVVGTVVLTFSSCFAATLDYVFTEPEEKAGQIDLQRITPDINCELLDAQ